MKKSIYQNASMNTIIGLFFLAALMIGFSVYLTTHYFAIHFPTGMESASMCNLNGFFNCDNTTNSPLSNIAGVPISVFGILIGSLVLVGLFFKSDKFEKTLYFILSINMIGCIILFLYSLVILKGLCPFCTLYYVASALTLFMFYKKSDSFMPDIPMLIAVAVIFGFVSFAVKMNVNSRIEKQSSIAQSLVSQFYALPNLGQPTPASDFKLAHANEPVIKMQIFSDFECPACKMLSEQVPAIIQRYAGKIEIQYYYFPLDHNCNPSITRPMHQEACRGAYFTTCMGPEKFMEAHDDVFANQENLKSFLDKAIADNKLESCVNDPKTKAKVVEMINASNPFNVRSTPTFILNGVKIEGVLPNNQLFVLMDEIINRAKNM